MPTIPLSSRILRDLQIILIYPQKREILGDSEQLDGPESHGGGGKRDCRALTSHKDSHKGSDRDS